MAISLVDAVRHAFATGGPVMRVLGQHRPAQVRFALDLAHYISRDSDLDAVLLKEAFAGMGKTDAVLVVVGLDCLLADHHSLIATFKRSLRGDYIAAMDRINQVIEMTLGELDSAALFHTVTFGEYKSSASYVSPAKMARLQTQLDAGLIRPHPVINNFLRCYQEHIEAGVDPEFNDLYEHAQLPADTNELHWAFSSADRDTELAQHIREQHDEARQADIILVTHAMLVRNSIAKGRVLNTTNGEDTGDDIMRDGVAIIDEAEKLFATAYDSATAQISLNDLRALINEIETAYHPSSTRRGDSVLAIGREVIATGLFVLSSWLDDNVERIVVLNADDPLSKAMTDALRDVDQGLRRFLAVAQGEYHPDDHDVMLADEIIRTHQEIAMILSADTIEHSKVAIRATYDDHGEPDVQVIVNFGSGRHLINQLWRSQSHAGVAMISATLTDMPPYQDSYERFLTSIGYDPTEDHFIQSRPLARNAFGRIQEVIVADRTAPHPTDADDVDHISEAFVEFAGIGLTALADRQLTMPPETRMLVLFPSYRLLDRVWAQVPALHERINRTQRGSNLKGAIRTYATMDHGIWFGVEWEGVNFIHPESRRTLADLMVIVRLPQPPSDDIRISRLADVFGDTTAAQRRAEFMALKEATNAAYHRTIHGLARGLRNASDQVQLLMILDARFPVPPHVTETRRIARASSDPMKLFMNFNSCLDPYSVRRWSQVNLDGSFTRIL